MKIMFGNRITIIKRRLTRFSTSGKGDSLIEVLVSGMILAFMVSTVATVVATNINLETSNNIRRQARSILRSEFEQLFNFRNFNTIPEDTTYSAAVVVYPLAHGSINGNRSVRIVTNSFGTNSGTDVQVKHITLTVSWTDLKGGGDSLQFVKDIADVE